MTRSRIEPAAQAHLGSGPLHPLTFELAERHPAPRAALHDTWKRLLGGPRFPLEHSSIGEMPLIASRTLIDAIDRRIADLVHGLGDRLARQPDPAWPLAPAADVLSADLAVVEAPDTPLGWDLRWVELQTFTSLVSLIYTLHRAGCELWPELERLAFWGPPPGGRDWRAATQRWMAPEPGSVLLETAPWSQATRPDFEAARHWFGLTVVEPDALRARGRTLQRRDDDGRWRDVPHVANRLILHEAPDRAAVARLLASVEPGWNSHPAWFYRIDKSVMPELPLPEAERCARADRWRELGRPATALVLKQRHGFSGRAVKLAVSEDDLTSLDGPENWLVQPRFAPMPLLTARDGAPVYGEIRCVVALREGEPPWIACRLARMTRGPMASATSWSGAAGEGAVPVYAPPARD